MNPEQFNLLVALLELINSGIDVAIIILGASAGLTCIIAVWTVAIFANRREEG